MTDILTGVVYPWLEAFAVAVLPILGGVLMAWFRKRGASEIVIGAAERAAGAGYARMVASGKSLSDPETLAIGVAGATEYLIDRVPDAIKIQGLAPDAVAKIAGAQLGRLLAIDPNVKIGG